MAMLDAINQLNHELSEKQTELAKQEEYLFALMGNHHEGAKPIGYDDTVQAIIRILKDIAKISQAISIKYLSRAVYAENDYEENSLLATASNYARTAHEAEEKIKSYEAPSN